MLQPGDTFVCNECGFEVPADNGGVELIQQHLADHRLERYRVKREGGASDTELCPDTES